jgi:hypothetical protein
MSRKFLDAFIEQVVRERPNEKCFDVVHHAVRDMIGTDIMGQFMKRYLRGVDLTALLIEAFVFLRRCWMRGAQYGLEVITIAVEREIHFLPEILLPCLSHVDRLTTAIKENVDPMVQGKFIFEADEVGVVLTCGE